MTRLRRVLIVLPFVTMGWHLDCRPRWVFSVYRRPVYWFGFTVWGDW